MALKIEWSGRADKKFDKILVYLQKEWGIKATRTFVRKVYDFLDLVIEFPEIGSLEHKKKNIRGFTIVRQINIFYRIKGTKIILLNFFDNRQSPKRKRF